MGLKKQFLDKVKENYTDFNSETDSVIIEFEGGGDSFDSFYSIEVTRYVSGEGYKVIDGDWQLNENDNMDFLFEIIDAADVDYSWINAGTRGTIKYEDGELSVETIVSNECWGTIEDEE